MFYIRTLAVFCSVSYTKRVLWRVPKLKKYIALYQNSTCQVEVPGGGAHLKIILRITTSQWYAKHSTVGIQITDLSGIQIINIIDSLYNEHSLLERERINT